ncbi:hypothetical protein KP509_05G095000 [Ceratopteris richardii]|uniref:Uncharacterized protein n=1 Tax=Ceratopteris richardii TaxID=49495 RepID=A0A8T2UP34_CERRI|nr:hypothetical protein KP509_05G095000 [Ceratopteris richardii]
MEVPYLSCRVHLCALHCWLLSAILDFMVDNWDSRFHAHPPSSPLDILLSLCHMLPLHV